MNVFYWNFAYKNLIANFLSLFNLYNFYLFLNLADKNSYLNILSPSIARQRKKYNNLAPVFLINFIFLFDLFIVVTEGQYLCK